MRKRLGNISLRIKVPVIFCMLLLLLVGLPCFAMYGYYYTAFSRTVEESLFNVVDTNANELYTLLKSIDVGVKVVNDNEQAYISEMENGLSDIANFIITYQPKDEVYHLYETVNDLNTRRRYFKELFNTVLLPATDKVCTSLLVFEEYPISRYLGRWISTKSGGFLSCREMSDKEWYRRTLESNGQIYWFSIDGEPDMLFMTKLLSYQDYRNSEYSIKNWGIIMLGFDIQWIEGRISTSKLTKDSQIFIATEEGKQVYTSRSNGAVSSDVIEELVKAEKDCQNMYQQYGGVRYWVQKNDLGYGLVMITLIPTYDVQQMAVQMVKIILIVLIVIIMLGILSVSVICKYMMKPILNLVALMERGLLEDVEDKSMNMDEIGLLYREYNRLQQRIRELLQEAWHSAQHQKKTEMQALQAQINPHFVLNTLASVSSYALMNGQDQIASQLTILSAVMRYNVREPDIMVPLGEEIANIQKYEKIQRLTYGDSFQISYHLTSECEKICVPKLIIQPLVENSIIHMVPEGSTGEIAIVGRMHNDQTMVVTVADSGLGVDCNLINQYMRGECSLDTAKDSFGVRNVYERLRLVYGEDAELVYRNDREGHTEAVITIRNGKSSLV